MSSPDGPLAAHVDPELIAAMAMGEPVDAEVSDHVGACAVCGDELVALSETLALVGGAEQAFVAPPPSVWEGIAAQIAADEQAHAAGAPARTATTPPPSATPGAATLPVGEDGPTATVTPLRRFAKVPAWAAAVAASVTLVAGVGVGAMIASPDDEETPAPQAQVLGSAALTTLDDAAEDRGAAQVRRHDDRVVLHVEASDLGGPDGTREVWLINVDGSRMVSLGLLPPGEAGDFDFPERLLEQGYRIVDISYEPDDGDPTHSGDSLARGTIDG
ncbi:anti-sigma factor [Nocardioides sp. Y6]|uniref:Anti-sigma factor n=1 Tax=Nocardioides malaquae TaxID=2773426 RepID=A0ABR9RW75_9ACTN|nr:anti-sigma factor [Nocardioides malaquae]MBE7325841.1 anti-sigma factor [Nocardioides malaquae]